MKTKTYRAKIELKADADKNGQFAAEFATIGVIDHDQDVTEAGAFEDGQETMIEAWNHNYGQLPVGKGVIHERDDKAVIEGAFFMDTQGGQEHYKTVKALGDLQEWSYTFEIVDSGQGKFEDQDVRFLRKLDVWGIAPVQRGAGIDTRTVDIKGLKPYPNEHACRLRDPGDFQEDSFRRVTRETDGKRYAVIMGRLEGESTMTEQAYRYPTKDWEADEARAHCRDHEGRFEAAAEKAGARHTAKEYETLQSIHDMVVELGATCPGHDDTGGDEGEGGDQGEAGDGKLRNPSRDSLAARVAMELIEAGIDD